LQQSAGPVHTAPSTKQLPVAPADPNSFKLAILDLVVELAVLVTKSVTCLFLDTFLLVKFFLANLELIIFRVSCLVWLTGAVLTGAT
jgi:hypothetical protein